MRPTINEEIYQKDRFKKGQHWHTIEGAFYFYKEGTHYLMYSGACYQNPTYFIGYSIAHGPEDADLAHTSVDEISGRSYVCAAFDSKQKRSRVWGITV